MIFSNILSVLGWSPFVDFQNLRALFESLKNLFFGGVGRLWKKVQKNEIKKQKQKLRPVVENMFKDNISKFLVSLEQYSVKKIVNGKWANNTRKILILAAKMQIRYTCVDEIAHILPLFDIFMQLLRCHVSFVAKVDYYTLETM